MCVGMMGWVLGFRYPGAAVDGWLSIITTEKKNEDVKQ
jgi:hypothetical protein